MILRPILAALVPLLALACGKDPHRERPPDETGLAEDTGCPDDDTGTLPAGCGTGTWGDLQLDESTVYVDGSAAGIGDGSESAPFATIQAGLDAAGDAGGGLVAVAAGTYPETLALNSAHADVQLAGRCHELVTIDASVGGEQTPGIDVKAKTSELAISGVTVSESPYVGLLVGSGTLTIRDSQLVGNGQYGMAAHQATLYQTVLLAESCEVLESTGFGVFATDSGTTVTLRDTTVQDTRTHEDGQGGYGIEVQNQASLQAESSQVSDSGSIGVVAQGSDTTVTLRQVTIQDTQADASGESGFGILVYDGAELNAEACEVNGNTGIGVMAGDSGTAVTLADTTIQDTRQGEGWALGIGLFVAEGARLEAEACEISGNTTAGIRVSGASSTAIFQDATIRDTQPMESGDFGYGVVVDDGASLELESCQISGNTGAGLTASGAGTSVELRDTTVVGTRRGEVYTVGMGVAVQEAAAVEATDLEVSSNQGPGLYVIYPGSQLSCAGCALSQNQFAGAVVVRTANLVIEDCTIEGSLEQENLGGGVGVYAASWDGSPPSLAVTGCTIQGNPIAGAWLSGEGSYSLSGNTILAGEGWTRESLNKCGDAVYAQDSGAGLLLEGNLLQGGRGAGLLLDSASATLAGNSYADNAVDLVRQGAGCETPPAGFEAETLGSVELCPDYDYATCGDEFTLFLELAEPELGKAAALPLRWPGSCPQPRAARRASW